MLYFYLEYGTAYFLWQDNITGHGQPYATFVAGYQNTLHDDITITKIAPNTNNTAFDRPVTTPFDMSVTIYALERGNKKSTYHADYTVGIVDGSWRIIKGHIDN